MEATPERLGIDPDTLARLAEKTDVTNLLSRLNDLDSRDLDRLAGGARPARPQRSPEPPSVDGDFYDVFKDLTDHQKHVKKAVRAFMQETVAPTSNEAWEKAVFPRDLISPAGELFADIVGDDYTFPPDDPIATGIVSYEMSRIDPSFCTFWGVHTGLSMGSLSMFGSEEQKAKYLEPMKKFDMVGSWALTEPKHGSDASRGLETTAEKKGDTWILNGAKKWSGNATFADVNVIWARDTRDGNVKGFLVELGTPGYEVEKLPGKVSKRAVENVLISIDNVEVPEANRLPGVEKFADVGRQLASCRAGVAWEAAGLAAGAYEKALDYCNNRMQFGKRITSFQMVQDQLVRMLGKVTALQTFVMQLGRAEERDGYISAERASLAKVWCCDTMREVVAIARGVMGGNGILLEHDVARLFADAEAVYAYEGSREMNALIVGRGITGQSAFV